MTQPRTKHKKIQGWIKSQPPERQDKLAHTLHELQRLLPTKDTSLSWHYEFGVLLGEFFTSEHGEYDREVARLLAEALGAQRRNEINNVCILLWKCRAIAKGLTTKEAKVWGNLKKTNGQTLTAYHFHCVVAIEDKDLRKELIKQCVKESWSVVRLRAEVQNRFGKKRSHGGRPAKQKQIPSPLVALQDIRLAVKHWKASQEVWFEGSKAALVKVAKRHRTEHFEAELESTVSDLQDLRDAVETALGQLEKLNQSR